MHEMAIVRSIIATVCEYAEGRTVHRVDVEVGALCAVVPDAMLFCFEVAAEGTVAAGAHLHIEQPLGAAHCRRCGADFPVSELIALCPCGSTDAEIRSGQQLRIRSMEVSETCAQPADAATTPQQ